MLDFNGKLLALDGKPVLDETKQEITLGKMLANQIAFSGKGDALKLFGWAQKMYANEVLDLDATDTETLKSLIKDNDQMTILAKAQLLEVFNKK